MSSPSPLIALRELSSSDSSTETASSSGGFSTGSGDTSLTTLTLPQSPHLKGDDRLDDIDLSSTTISGSPALSGGEEGPTSGDAEVEANGRRSSTVTSQLREAVQSGWKKLLDKKLTFAQALFVFTINLVLLALQIITVLTSNQPTSVDRQSLQQEVDTTEMQKALLQKAVEGVKAANSTLDISKESLLTEIQLLQTERESLAAEKASLDDQKQLLELAKWTAYHEYIKGCAAYAVPYISLPHDSRPSALTVEC